MKEVSVIVEKLGLSDYIKAMPRIVGRQQHRSNHTAESDSEFWGKSLVIPYLDSIIVSLEIRCGEENTPSFALMKLHSGRMLATSI